MKPTSHRLPDYTLNQLAAIAKRLGMTQTQALILAIERMAKQEKIK